MNSQGFLLDTNICIYVIKHRPAEVRQKFAAHTADELCISVISLGELLFGAKKSQAPEKALAALARLTETIEVRPLPALVGEHYGDIRYTLSTRGEIIGNNDLWLAAHARAEGLTLVTNNEREFVRVPGLRVENWVSPPR